MSRKTRIQKFAAVAAVLGFGTVVAQSPLFNRAARLSPDPLPVLLPSVVVFGAPLAGLSAGDLEMFVDGLGDFSSADTAASGLGPTFNNVSCVACHSVPAPGGGSAILETRFGRLQNGHFDALVESGGSLLQQSAIAPECQETIPPEANVIAQRMTTPLFGLGLIEAIPDQAILRNAQGRQPDNVTGRASLVLDVATGVQRVFRFGWKAQQATILAFAGDAYLNQIGITNRLFPSENAPNGDVARLARCDTVVDPEDQPDAADGKADIDRLTDFMRLLVAVPARDLIGDKCVPDSD